MKRLVFAVALLSSSAWASTTITDTLHKADGTTCSGTINISWQNFYDSTNTLQAAGSTQTAVTNGSFSITLATGYVNASNPSGFGYYAVAYNLTPTGCVPPQDNWNVYASMTPLNLGQVRTLNAPVAYTLIPPSWISVDGATPGQCMIWNGVTWGPSSGCGGSAGGGGANTYYSIIASGADPTGAVDSSSAINAALSGGYNYVTAPCGTFKIGSMITIPSGVSFVDSGACTTFNYTGTGTAFYSPGAIQGQLITMHVTKSSQQWVSGGDVSSIGFKQTDALLNATFRVYAANFWTGLLVTNETQDNFGNTYEFEGVNNKIGLHVNGTGGHASADSIFNNVLVNISSGVTCPGGSPITGTYYILLEGDETNILMNKPNLENHCVQYNLYISGDNNIIMGARLEAIAVGGAYIAGSQNTIISPYTPNGEYFPYITNAGTGNTYVGNYGFVMDTAGAGISPIFITAPALGTMFNLDVRGDLYASGTRLALTNANFNTFVGANSGNVLGTGLYNAALGQGALGAYTSGIRSTALGAGALGQATSSANTAAGYAAGYGIVSGTQNTCLGNISCFADAAGNDNTIVGDGGLNAATASDNNSSVGAQALIGLTTGGGNTAMGLWAGRFISDGVTANQTSLNSLYLGINTQPLADGDTDETVIGFVAKGHGSHTTTLGSATTQNTYIAGKTHFPSLYHLDTPVGFTGIPTCNSGTLLDVWAVNDATVATPGSAYAGSGTYTTTIKCTYNSSGSAYAWLID